FFLSTRLLLLILLPLFFFLMLRRPPRSTLFPSRRSSDLFIENSIRKCQLNNLHKRETVFTYLFWATINNDVKFFMSDDEFLNTRDRKSTRLNSSHVKSRMPSSA